MTIDVQMDEAGAIDDLFGDSGWFWIIEAIQEAIDHDDIGGLQRLRHVAALFQTLRHRP